MPGPMSAPNGNWGLTVHGEDRRKLQDGGKLVTGKSAGDTTSKESKLAAGRRRND